MRRNLIKFSIYQTILISGFNQITYAKFSFDNKTELIKNPKYYADINYQKDKSWYQYENFTTEWGNQDDYEVYNKLGKGKYSEVFSGVDLVKNKEVVIKILKPVKVKKINREISVLQKLRGHDNIVDLVDQTLDPSTNTPVLIFEHINAIDLRDYDFQDFELKFYIYQILKGLDYAHSQGIMHRDIKPGNLIIDPFKKILKIIDWGLAEFYFPDGGYNIRVGTKPYKSPELLIDIKYQDYQMDIWMTGAVFGGVLFDKDVLFRCEDNDDLLIKLIKQFGTVDFQNYLDKYNVQMPSVPEEFYNKKLYKKQGWDALRTASRNQDLLSDDAIDLLNKMLTIDPLERITAKDAMEHPYFEEVRKYS